MIINLEYELFAYCTSIVSHDKNGDIIHGRNMDYPLYKALGDLTYNADFKKNGELVYTATMFAGFTGVFTAMKPGKFAISINERQPHAFGGLFINIFRWLTGPYSPATLLRYACETAENYEEAKHMLTTYQITAPVYLTVSGVAENEGAIITRDRTGAADVWLLNSQSPTDWAIAETNYDHWITPAPEWDRGRANSAKHALNELKDSRLDSTTLLENVLQLPPVHNIGTIYSTVMSAKRSYLKSVRYY